MSDNETTGATCVAQLVILSIWLTVGTLWTDRNLDFWLTHIKGVPVDAPWYLSTLLTIFAPITFAANIISEVARLVV